MRCAGVLLTGGDSRRMGVDKATMGHPPLADRAAACLRVVTVAAVEVGPGVTALPHITEDPPGQGPLAAFAAGIEHLGTERPILLLACDLPHISADLLNWLSDHPSPGSVVPDTGSPQPLCARWSPAALSKVAFAVEAGERGFRSLLSYPDVALVHPPAELAKQLDDVDTPEDWQRVVGHKLGPDGS